MFKLKDGRTELWQWDINNFITVEDKSITQVHFYRDFIDNTIVVKVVEGEARIPDELLQKSGILEIYAITDNHTVVQESFTINMKVKPADYIYTPTEVKTWEGKLDKSGWTPNKVLGTNEAGDVVPVEGGTGGVISVNGKTGRVNITSYDVYCKDYDTIQDKLDNGSLKGDKGDTGPQGPAGKDGAKGADGATGPKGDTGAAGKDGVNGKDATINGVNALTIEQGENITLAQEGSKLTISAVGGGATADVPIATTQTAGKVKPDGTTITVAEDGTISAASGGGGGAKLPLKAVGDGSMTIGQNVDTDSSTYGKYVKNSILTPQDGATLGDSWIQPKVNNSIFLNSSFQRDAYPEITNALILDSQYINGSQSFRGIMTNGANSEINASTSGILSGRAIYVNKDAYDSHALCQGATLSSNNQFITGKWNLEDGNNTYAVIVGTGKESAAVWQRNDGANGYTLDWQGNGTYAGKVSSTGADYAEYFEWVDGNTAAADRVGYIVSLEGDKIKFANETDDVLGIISGTVGVLGDNYEWQWQGKYQTDEFGRVIYDMVEEFHTDIDKDGNEIKTSLGMFPHPRIVSTFDANKEYVNRANRPEWDAVGMMGKLFVRDDGTAQVGGYVKPVEGIATASETKTRMRVMSRVSDNVIRVCLI